MRWLPLTIGLLLIVALTAHDFYEFFVADEGISYFSSQPLRLLYVALLGVTGGGVALIISRMSPGSQRKLKLTVLGGLGTSVTFFSVFFAYHLKLAPSKLIDVGMRGSGTVALISLMSIAALVWWEFRRVWKRS